MYPSDEEIQELFKSEASRIEDRSKTGISFEMMEKQYEGYYWEEFDYWDNEKENKRN